MTMAGLPRKYALMGFKRGWAAYKASKRSKSRKVTTMARRRTSRRRARAAPRATKRRRSSSRGMMSGFIPLSGQEIALDFAIGATVAPLSEFLRPYQTQYLGMFGDYSDEAALAIVGAVAHKYGSGVIKQGGKELFRVAVISAGAQTGGKFLTGASAQASSGATQYNGWV